MLRFSVGLAALVFSTGLVGVSFAKEFKSADYRLDVSVLASGLEHPWGLAFLPDGGFLITEREGRMRIVRDGKLSASLAGLPTIAAEGQGGLLDVVLAPDFAKSRLVFFTFSEPRKGAMGTALASGALVMGAKPRLDGVKVLFRQNKPSDGGRHFGSRIVFAPDGTLFLTIGDRGERPRAQDPFDHAGSVIRLNRDGTVPADNPFADGKKAAPEIWSIGHRNPQGAAWNKTRGALVTVEHGARGGDEINRPEKGKNYGWPVISYGRHYWGGRIGEGTHKAGLEQPVHYWDPSIAPSGLAVYQGAPFAKWQGNLLVGALKDEMLVRLVIKDGKVVTEERLLQGAYGRIRDVRVGPKGAIYLLTDDSDGQLLKVEVRR